MQKYIFIVFFVLFIGFTCCQLPKAENAPIIKTGAERTGLYFPLLIGKSVAIVANHTSLIDTVHLVDSLVKSGITVVKFFSPEHGFRGTKDAGESINDNIDPLTNIPIVSLYGKKKKPGAQDLNQIDVIIFDIQDVGVRFYTYISTLHYIMEACAENNIPLVVLDRPNPNGFYVDGPLLQKKYRSFVGMHPVPIVYGLTIGEYAQMINGEGWLNHKILCKLTVIPCKNYTHNSRYSLPVNPSPNLRNMKAVYLYPSLGLFEGTVMNVGRGTDFPFQVIGHPGFPGKDFFYVPKPSYGAGNPKHNNLKCFGLDLRSQPVDSLANKKSIDLYWLILAYKKMNLGEKFFTGYFNSLAGNDVLKQQIIEGISIEEIKNSWNKDIEKYKKTRIKYLLYPDFE